MRAFPLRLLTPTGTNKDACSRHDAQSAPSKPACRTDYKGHGLSGADKLSRSKNETLPWHLDTSSGTRGLRATYAVNEANSPLPLTLSVLVKCLFLATLRSRPNQIHTNRFSETTLIPKLNSLKLFPFSYFSSFKKVSTQPGTKEIISMVI